MNRQFALLLIACSALSACKRADAVTMTQPRSVSDATMVGTAPMFTVSQQGTQAVAWVSAPAGGTDGRLYIAVGGRAPIELRDTLGPIEAHGESPPKLVYGPDNALNALYVVAKVVPGKRFPLAALRFVRSTDGGSTWSSPVTVTDDSVFGSHNFHALHSAADGTLYVAWLDGREGKSAAFITRSQDAGRTWLPNHRVSMGEACPCCRTAIATTADGALLLAWRMVYPGNIRDIVVAQSKDHGETFGEPVRVHADNWHFDGCPHAGPSMQVDAAGRVHIAWWTGAEGKAGVFYARSDDGGRTFGPAIDLGTAQFSKPAHVQLALGPNNTVVTTWDDGTKQVAQVVMRVSRDGGKSFGPAQALSTAGRSAGFPVLAVAGSGVTVAWSEESAQDAQAAAKAMPNMKDPHAAMGLHAVGNAQVMMRTGKLE